jgi:hypothetical protein
MMGIFFSINPLLWNLCRQIDDRIEPALIKKESDDADFQVRYLPDFIVEAGYFF